MRVKKGPVVNNDILHLRIPTELKDRLQAWADADMRTISNFVHLILHEYAQGRMDEKRKAQNMSP